MSGASELFSPVVAGMMRLGLWGAKYSTDEYERFIEGCLDMGVYTFDHADIYGDYTTEGDFGKVLKRKPSLRDKMKIVTKCGIRMVCPQRPEHHWKSYDSSAEHIIWSAENSLKELETDHIDLMLLHRPDILMDADEVAEAFEKLRKAGKVSHFGVSNFTASQFELLNAKTPLVTNQIEVSLLHLDPFTDGTLDQCQQKDIPVMAWSPLGGGSLFATHSEDQQIWRVQDKAQLLSEKYHTQMDVLMYAWLLQHPVKMYPVTGTTRLERVKAAVDALDIKINRADWYALYKASTGKEIA